MKQTFSKSEKLKSEKQLSALFTNGHTVTAFPLKLIFMPMDFSDNVKIKVGVSVPKRRFKKAVDRIRIKRLMREAYRLNKRVLFNNITTQYALMILYIGDEKPSYAEVESTMIKLFEKFLDHHSVQQTNEDELNDNPTI